MSHFSSRTISSQETISTDASSTAVPKGWLCSPTRVGAFTSIRLRRTTPIPPPLKKKQEIQIIITKQGWNDNVSIYRLKRTAILNREEKYNKKQQTKRRDKRFWAESTHGEQQIRIQVSPKWRWLSRRTSSLKRASGESTHVNKTVRGKPYAGTAAH